MRFREIEKIVLNDGWELVDVRGSHHQYKHPTKTGKVTIPNHRGDIPQRVVNSILKQASLLSWERGLKLLNDGAHTATNLTDGAKSSGAGASNTTPVKSNTKVDVAHGFNKSLAGTYKVTASGLNLRAGAGTGKSILAVMENGEKVQCYGYYNDHNGVKWLYVVYKNIVGYASSKYLSK